MEVILLDPNRPMFQLIPSNLLKGNKKVKVKLLPSVDRQNPWRQPAIRLYGECAICRRIWNLSACSSAETLNCSRIFKRSSLFFKVNPSAAWHSSANSRKHEINFYIAQRLTSKNTVLQRSVEETQSRFRNYSTHLSYHKNQQHCCLHHHMFLMFYTTQHHKKTPHGKTLCNIPSLHTVSLSDPYLWEMKLHWIGKGFVHRNM